MFIVACQDVLHLHKLRMGGFIPSGSGIPQAERELKPSGTSDYDLALKGPPGNAN
jgi:hypothetical protein